MATTALSTLIALGPLLTRSFVLACVVFSIWLPFLCFLISALSSYLAKHWFGALESGSGTIGIALSALVMYYPASLQAAVAGAPFLLVLGLFPVYPLTLMVLSLRALGGVNILQASICVGAAVPLGVGEVTFFAALNRLLPGLS